MKNVGKAMAERYFAAECFSLGSSTRAAGVKGNFWPLQNFRPIIACQYFASQSKGIEFGDYFFDLCCVIKTIR